MSSHQCTASPRTPKPRPRPLTQPREPPTTPNKARWHLLSQVPRCDSLLCRFRCSTLAQASPLSTLLELQLPMLLVNTHRFAYSGRLLTEEFFPLYKLFIGEPCVISQFLSCCLSATKRSNKVIFNVVENLLEHQHEFIPSSSQPAF